MEENLEELREKKDFFENLMLEIPKRKEKLYHQIFELEEQLKEFERIYPLIKAEYERLNSKCNELEEMKL